MNPKWYLFKAVAFAFFAGSTLVLIREEHCLGIRNFYIFQALALMGLSILNTHRLADILEEVT